MTSALTYVLGAPGSGKTTVAPLLRHELPHHIVIDWDAFMDQASDLYGADVRRSPVAWRPYRDLVHRVVAEIAPRSVVVLGPCTPEELPQWSIGQWLLLDCDDHERARRLGADMPPAAIADALRDAATYRSLGMAQVNSTGVSAEETAKRLVSAIEDCPS